MLIIIGTVLVDQVSKILVVEFLNREESLVIIKGIFQFTYVENDGMAFGLLGEHRWIFMVLSVIGIAAVFIYLWKFRPQSKLACVALSFIVGGGIGNMIDRIFRMGTQPDTIGKKVVIDFIDFYAFPDLWKYVFNAADSFVCVGAGMLIVYLVVDLIKETKSSKAQALAEAVGEAEDGGEDKDE